jgi:hypothetical protein
MWYKLVTATKFRRKLHKPHLVDRYGVNGHNCMLRALCEAKERLKPGKSFVEDILHVVFR